MKKNKEAIFTISLDFELYWGMRDKSSIEQYSKNLDGVEEAINQLLKTFTQNSIHATWATVGFLFYDVENLKNSFPNKLPQYKNSKLSPYSYIERNSHLEKKYHSAQEIIKNISNDKNQEIATHTFSHYYCLEEGQTKEEFYADIQQAIKTIKDETGEKTYSLVFPRNQWKEEYLSVLSKLDILSYRGTEKSWIYDPKNEENNFILKRAVKLLDTYINISGHNTYSLDELKANTPFNIPASRFLRPVSKKLSFLEGMKLNRIKNSMTHAAKNRELFHLWWHPHNFGVDLESNLEFLNKILEHYKYLNKKYNMKSLNMKEVSLQLRGKNES